MDFLFKKKNVMAKVVFYFCFCFSILCLQFVMYWTNEEHFYKEINITNDWWNSKDIAILIKLRKLLWISSIFRRKWQINI